MVGGSRVGGRGDPWRLGTEDTPLRPADLYGRPKVAAEDIGQYHADVAGMPTVSFRLGMFEQYGFRLLFGGVDDRDVAHAVLRALDRLFGMTECFTVR